jgi:hypothetical protein
MVKLIFGSSYVIRYRKAGSRVRLAGVNIYVKILKQLFLTSCPLVSWSVTMNVSSNTVENSLMVLNTWGQIFPLFLYNEYFGQFSCENLVFFLSCKYKLNQNFGAWEVVSRIYWQSADIILQAVFFEFLPKKVSKLVTHHVRWSYLVKK